MKNSSILLIASFTITAASLAFWLISGGSFPTEVLFGSYTAVGALYIADRSYAPALRLQVARRADRTWVKRSLGKRSTHLRPTASSAVA